MRDEEMKKKVYALKNGTRPGVYRDWCHFFEQIADMEYVESRSFAYDTELERESEVTRYSLNWALKQAREYLNGGENFDDQEEMHQLLGIEPELREGSPWLDMLLSVVGKERPKVSGGRFTGRYFATSLYVMLLTLVLDTEWVLDEVFENRQKTLSKKMDAVDRQNWYESVRYELLRAEEFIRLKEHFEALHLDRLDLNEIRYRNVEYANGRNLLGELASYEKMKQFLKSGRHTIADLYRELIENGIYRKELLTVTGPYDNPDLKQPLKREEKAASLQQLVAQTAAIRSTLKNLVVGQDAAVDKLYVSYFHNEKRAHATGGEGRPRSVYLFAGPSGVGKTYLAENFARATQREFRRFDMSGYATVNALDEIAGISSFYRNAKEGVLTGFVNNHPDCVLLFDEIEKASTDVVRIFLQILDEGTCFDRFYDRNVSFEDCIIIMTTNAGKQLYENHRRENLTELPDRVVIDALEKDVNPDTKVPYFPPEIVSRMAANTIIVFNHLKPDAIRRVICQDVRRQIEKTKEAYGLDMEEGSEVVAATVQYAIGGGGDARNASKLAGKLVDKELYELVELLGEKETGSDKRVPAKVCWACDFTNASEDILTLYHGENNCVIPVLKETVEPRKTEIYGDLRLEIANSMEGFAEIVQKEHVSFAVIDYACGICGQETSISIADARTTGKKVFEWLKNEEPELPVYLLRREEGYRYSQSEEKQLLLKGAEGFLAEEDFVPQLARVRQDICCNRAMEMLSLRHQVLTYRTRKEMHADSDCARIWFYDLKLEMAADMEDRLHLISEELRPDITWEDIYVSDDIREELQFFIRYLKKPGEFMRAGVRVPRGALLYGPPGTGKTSLAKVVAAESGVNFLSVGADELAGGGAGKIHEIFRVARKYAPAVLFIDELDAIGVSRKISGSNAVLNALLTEMDGVKKAKTEPVFVMAATNLKGIDGALARRFDRAFIVNLPEADGRKWVMERFLKTHADWFEITEKECDSLVVRSTGMSFADIENMLETALREGIRSDRAVKDETLDEIFEKCSHGERREWNTEEDVLHTAFHEAGHVIVELVNGRVPEYMSIIAREDFGGYMKPERMTEHPTKERLLEYICMALGGRAAEMEFGYGLTPGAASDLKVATDLAAKMVGSYGMYEEEIGLAVFDAEKSPMNEEAVALVNRILREQLGKARKIVALNRAVVEKLVETTRKSGQKCLRKKEIEQIYQEGKDAGTSD